jgi:hypothetical protein
MKCIGKESSHLFYALHSRRLYSVVNTISVNVDLKDFNSDMQRLNKVLETSVTKIRHEIDGHPSIQRCNYYLFSYILPWKYDVKVVVLIRPYTTNVQIPK